MTGSLQPSVLTTPESGGRSTDVVAMERSFTISNTDELERFGESK
jgi:hypothetical protein